MGFLIFNFILDIWMDVKPNFEGIDKWINEWMKKRMDGWNLEYIQIDPFIHPYVQNKIMKKIPILTDEENSKGRYDSIPL